MLSSKLHKRRKQENFRDQSTNLEMLWKSETEGRPPWNDSKKNSHLQLPSVGLSDASSIWKVRDLRAGVPFFYPNSPHLKRPPVLCHPPPESLDLRLKLRFVPLHKGQRFIPNILCPLYQNHNLFRMEICHLSKETNKLTVLRLPYRWRWLIKQKGKSLVGVFGKGF